jgi:hypothetical protein
VSSSLYAAGVNRSGFCLWILPVHLRNPGQGERGSKEKPNAVLSPNANLLANLLACWSGSGIVFGMVRKDYTRKPNWAIRYNSRKGRIACRHLTPEARVGLGRQNRI